MQHAPGRGAASQPQADLNNLRTAKASQVALTHKLRLEGVPARSLRWCMPFKTLFALPLSRHSNESVFGPCPLVGCDVCSLADGQQPLRRYALASGAHGPGIGTMSKFRITSFRSLRMRANSKSGGPGSSRGSTPSDASFLSNAFWRLYPGRSSTMYWDFM